MGYWTGLTNVVLTKGWSAKNPAFGRDLNGFGATMKALGIAETNSLKLNMLNYGPAAALALATAYNHSVIDLVAPHLNSFNGLDIIAIGAILITGVIKGLSRKAIDFNLAPAIQPPPAPALNPAGLTLTLNEAKTKHDQIVQNIANLKTELDAAKSAIDAHEKAESEFNDKYYLPTTTEDAKRALKANLDALETASKEALKKKETLKSDIKKASEELAAIVNHIDALEKNAAATPPVATPPVATPPVATPPAATPPVAQPAAVQPPVATPPVATPPVATTTNPTIVSGGVQSPVADPNRIAELERQLAEEKAARTRAENEKAAVSKQLGESGTVAVDSQALTNLKPGVPIAAPSGISVDLGNLDDLIGLAPQQPATVQPGEADLPTPSQVGAVMMPDDPSSSQAPTNAKDPEQTRATDPGSADLVLASATDGLQALASVNPQVQALLAAKDYDALEQLLLSDHDFGPHVSEDMVTNAYQKLVELKNKG